MPVQRGRRASAAQSKPVSGKQPLVDKLSTKERITQRINIMLVEHGLWGLNKQFLKPENVPPDILAEVRKISFEDGETVDSRARDDAYFNYQYLDRKKLGVLLREYAEKQINGGKTEELLRDGLIIPSETRKWREKDARVAAVKILVEVLAKKLTDVTQKDFNKNGLGGLLAGRYNSSPYEAVKEAFPELDLKPWEMKITPTGFFDEEKNRFESVKWLVKTVGKKPTDLCRADFKEGGLGGLLKNHYNNSPYKAVIEAFPKMNIRPWEMKNTPCSSFDDKENRVAGVRWLVEKLGKKPTEVIKRDFYENGLVGIMNRHGDSPYKAIKEAYPELDIKPWEMKRTTWSFWKKKENRAGAVRWLIKKLGKKPTELTVDDFHKNSLAGLLNRHGDSPYKAVKEVFPDIEPEDMKNRSFVAEHRQ